MSDLTNQNQMNKKEVNAIRWWIILFVFLINFGLLFSSELIASIFSMKLDAIDADLGYRILFAFKPSVLAVFFAAFIIVLIMILSILNPLFSFLQNGKNFERARRVTIRMPWVILTVSQVLWVFGTVAYFIMKNWQADSGIPLGWVIIMKTSIGLIASVFTAIFVHVITLKLKYKLNVFDMGEKDTDVFVKYKDLFIVLSLVYFICANTGYIAYYYSLSPELHGGEAYFYWGILGVTLFYFIVALVLMRLSRIIFSYQVNFLKHKFYDFTTGHADLTKRILLINFDDLGEISHSFNRFMEFLCRDFISLRDQVVRLRSDVQVLTGSSSDLASGAEKQSATTVNISRSMEEFNRIMQEIRGSIREHADIINQNAQTAKVLSDNLLSVIETSKAVRDKSSVNLDSAKGGIEIANRSVDKTLRMGGNLQEIARYIQSAGEQTERIDEILGSIQDIAESTNMLAMNASIEAAHAGEAGKGFAIVANEIRTLAENSANAVRDISGLVGDIKESVEEAVAIARVGSAEAEETKNLANTAGTALQSITEEIRQSAEMIVEISDLTEKQGGSIRGISEASEQLASISEKIQASVEEQADGAEGIGKALVSLSGSIKENAEYAEKLAALARNLETLSEQITGLIKQFVID